MAAEDKVRYYQELAQYEQPRSVRHLQNAAGNEISDCTSFVSRRQLVPYMRSR